jgi:integrase
MLDGLAARASAGDPLELRDHAMLEVLYGAAVRVSELTGLDRDDVDLDRATVRVLGKGSKERVVPFGAPARRAIEAYITRGGFAHHSIPSQRRRDIAADARLVTRGYVVLRFDYHQILFEWDRLLETVVTAMAQGAHRRPVIQHR